MSNTWVTSDLHLGHSNIMQYCNRPFADVIDMNTTIISRWNERVKREDTVYHVGDFCFYKSKQGTPIKAIEYEKELNGNIIHVLGNHDKNNNTKGHMYKCELYFGGYNIQLQHKPPKTRSEIPSNIDFVLCGHVHNYWKEIYIEDLLVINVGVDVNKFYPVSLQEIVGYVSSLKCKEKTND